MWLCLENVKVFVLYKGRTKAKLTLLAYFFQGVISFPISTERFSQFLQSFGFGGKFDVGW